MIPEIIDLSEARWDQSTNPTPAKPRQYANRLDVLTSIALLAGWRLHLRTGIIDGRVPLIAANLKHEPSGEYCTWPACIDNSLLCDLEQRQIRVRATDDGGEDGGKLLLFRYPGLVWVLANCDTDHVLMKVVPPRQFPETYSESKVEEYPSPRLEAPGPRPVHY